MKKTIFAIAIGCITIFSACKKNNSSSKQFTLEMKVNGTMWTATKNQVGLYDSQDKSISISGETDNDLFRLTKDAGVTGVGTFALPSGNMSLFIGTGAAQKQYTIFNASPKARGSVTLLNTTPNSSGLSSLANTYYPEADFSGVLYQVLGTDSVVITEGKLRYQ